MSATVITVTSGKGGVGKTTTTAAFGAGFSRTEFSTYLPALYVAGTFCLVAALLVATLYRRPQMQPAE